MADRPQERFDIERVIAARLDDDTVGDSYHQALAVLIDADLSEAQREQAFASVMSALLARLDATQLSRFRRIAGEEGEAAAMTYLSEAARGAGARLATGSDPRADH